jgi:ribosome biogenesis GTPase
MDEPNVRSLTDFGWTDQHQKEWDARQDEGFYPARVVADFGTSLKIATPAIITAELSGKLAHYTDRELAPKVGDWVRVAQSDANATIDSVVFRSREIARKVAGKRTMKQILATNVDLAFVLLALDNDFSVERLNRYLYQLSVNAIEAVIVLNKADKTDDLQSYVSQLDELAVPIIITTATAGIGIADIAERIHPGKTAMLLGSSGVGKSTLTNALLGRQAQSTQAVRESDDTGKHTTVHRELFILPNGGILIDTPGIRELQLWGMEEDLETNFDDVIATTQQCAYSNCQHNGEAGCMIRIALDSGALPRTHYAQYVNMKRELEHLAVKNIELARLQNKRVTRHNKHKRDMERS